MTLRARCDLSDMTILAIAEFATLSVRDLSNNGLTGTIPRQFGNLTQLQYLYILNQTSCDCNLKDSLTIFAIAEFATLSLCQGSLQQ